MKFLSLATLAALLGLVGVSCDSHKWEDTKVLHDKVHELEGHHGDEAHGADGADNGEDHGKEEKEAAK